MRICALYRQPEALPTMYSRPARYMSKDKNGKLKLFELPCPGDIPLVRHIKI